MTNPTIADARSLLFVPGSRPDRFAKAAGSGADYIVIDLEDSVPPTGKNAARIHAERWLGTGHPAVVRINAPGSPWFDDDVTAFRATPGIIMVPKATLETVTMAAERLPARGQIIALIETAVGILGVADTARHPSVARLAFGNVDLAAALRVDPDDHLALSAARAALVLASAASQLPGPVDGVTTTMDDPSAIARDIRHAASLGYTGKLSIHPRQIPKIHEALAPTVEQITYARKVVDAGGDGGATALDGQMLDKPVLDRARQLLRRAGLDEY